MRKELVTSLELSQELKKLGVKQESEFYWIKAKDIKGSITWYLKYWQQLDDFNFEILDKISAFLSGELGEILPSDLCDDKGSCRVCDPLIEQALSQQRENLIRDFRAESKASLSQQKEEIKRAFERVVYERYWLDEFKPWENEKISLEKRFEEEIEKL